MTWDGADVTLIKIKCTINVMHLNYPQTISCSLAGEKKSSPKAVPGAKKVGDGLQLSNPLPAGQGQGFCVGFFKHREQSAVDCGSWFQGRHSLSASGAHHLEFQSFQGVSVSWCGLSCQDLWFEAEDKSSVHGTLWSSETRPSTKEKEKKKVRLFIITQILFLFPRSF